jgi:hypothetical protein
VDEYNGYQFRRESMAQDSEGKLIYPHNARFESGPFGDKAILVEEGTENLVNLRTWNPVREDSNQIVSATDKTFRGFPVYKAQKKTTATAPISLGKFDIPAGETITASIWVKAMDSVDRYPRVFFHKEAVMGEESRDVEVGEWGRLITTYTNDTDEIIEGVNVYYYASLPVDSITYFSSPQVEWKPYATTFTDGTRADEEIIIPTAGLLSPEQGTIEFDIMLLEQPSVVKKHMPLFQDLYIHQVNDWVYLHTGVNRFNTKILSDIWNRLAFTWSGGHVESMVMYLNGDRFPVRYDDERYPNLPNWWEKLEIFSKVGSRKGSKLLANLRLSSIARTQEQLAPLGAPPTVDEYTTLYLPFNGADGTRAAKSILI